MNIIKFWSIFYIFRFYVYSYRHINRYRDNLYIHIILHIINLYYIPFRSYGDVIYFKKTQKLFRGSNMFAFQIVLHTNIY